MRQKLLQLKEKLATGRPRHWLRLTVGGAALVTAISCATVTRTVIVPPNIPGAKFVGTQACAECHDELVRDFKSASHAGLQAKGPNAIHMGCESCHGPGSLHAESGGEKKPVYAYTPGKPRIVAVGLQPKILNPGRSPEVCFECHIDKKGSFSLPHHHPVSEGKMTCTDCHNPHKGSARKGGGTQIASINDACIKCHEAQHGPYVFEHEAMRDGCTTCHDPHGSVNAKMLTARNANLCLQCHFQQVTPGSILIGGANHTTSLQQGTCWTAGCHEAVHGSRVNSSLRF
jgi:predicted CXXCH cytochrome family protein